MDLYERIEHSSKNDEVADELMDALDQSGQLELEHVDRALDTQEHFLVGNADWKLTVRGNGSVARYRNFGYRASHPEVDALTPPSDSRAEQVARSFVSRSLDRHLRRSSKDQLVAWRTLHDREGGMSKNGSNAYERVATTIVVFKRNLNGIPVLGRGSEVSVTLANDETVIGFEYDWPEYVKSNKKQEVVNHQTGMDRVAAMTGDRKGKLEVPSFECGYFDPGIEYRDPYAPLQPACLSAIVSTTQHSVDGRDEEVRSGIVVVAPMGKTVEYDAELEKSHPLLNGTTGNGKAVQLGKGVRDDVRKAILTKAAR